MYYYKRVKDGKIASVEAKSNDVASPNFIPATKAEYDDYIASLPPPPPPEPARDLATEIDDLKARVGELKKGGII